MGNHRRRFLIVSCFVVFLAACALPVIRVSDYTRDDSQVVVYRDERFNIRLDANWTTGYSWRLENTYRRDIVLFVGNKYVDPNFSDTTYNIVGAAGYEIWTFHALKRGKTVLDFYYSRTWDTAGLPSKVYKTSVIVR